MRILDQNTVLIRGGLNALLTLLLLWPLGQVARLVREREGVRVSRRRRGDAAPYGMLDEVVAVPDPRACTIGAEVVTEEDAFRSRFVEDELGARPDRRCFDLLPAFGFEDRRETLRAGPEGRVAWDQSGARMAGIAFGRTGCK